MGDFSIGINSWKENKHSVVKLQHLKTEIWRLMYCRGLNPSEEAVQDIINEVDQDGSGKVSEKMILVKMILLLWRLSGQSLPQCLLLCWRLRRMRRRTIRRHSECSARMMKDVFLPRRWSLSSARYALWRWVNPYWYLHTESHTKVICISLLAMIMNTDNSKYPHKESEFDSKACNDIRVLFLMVLFSLTY